MGHNHPFRPLVLGMCATVNTVRNPLHTTRVKALASGLDVDLHGASPLALTVVELFAPGESWPRKTTTT